jgi:hypothetical protein
MTPVKSGRARVPQNSSYKEVRAPRNRFHRAWAKFSDTNTGTWTKRGDKSGKFMDVKVDPKPFKGVRKEKRK